MELKDEEHARLREVRANGKLGVGIIYFTVKLLILCQNEAIHAVINFVSELKMLIHFFKTKV